MNSQIRYAVYGMLIVVALGGIAGRILRVTATGSDPRTPFLSANDRSRWCTVRALVDHGTYAIDAVIAERGWDTIDKVYHRARDGQGHFYSSKPPLLATLVAGPYWVLKQASGVTFAEQPFYVGRFLLIATHVPAMAVYFVLLVFLIERIGTSDWGRIFAAVVATGATFLTTYAITLNNHLPAAVSVVITLFGLWHIVAREAPRAGWFAVAGLGAAFAAANELPALSLTVAIMLGLGWYWPRQTLVGYLPAALLVGAAFLATNYIAHDSLKPPYAHRADGWYDYPGSYWQEGKQEGIDRGEPSVARYAFHVLIGHHGIFSLTPVWLFSVAGALFWLARPSGGLHRAIALLTIGLMVVCLTFYIGLRPTIDRNYGGTTCSFRWIIWFTPLWLISSLPCVDRLSLTWWGRWLAFGCLTVSALSANYPAMNPWTHPWLYQYWQALGWA